ncbi:MAG: hypothetical protein WD058_01025 [Dehalococcoidia bacterium]
MACVLAVACAGATPRGDTSDIYRDAPFARGESLVYRIVDAEAAVIGHGTLEVTELPSGLLELRQAYVEADPPAGAPPVTDTVTVVVDPSTFRPRSGEREILRREADGTPSTERYDWTYVAEDEEWQITSTRGDAEGERDERTLGLRDHHYDNESSLWLWRSIDFPSAASLEAGDASDADSAFEAFYVSVNPIDRSQQTVNLRLPQTETVSVPAGEFEAYRLLLRSGRAVRTAWIEVAAPHRVLRWDNGESVLELLAP